MSYLVLILVLAAAIAFMVLALSVPFVIMRKAGFPGWYGLFIFCTFYFGLIWLALKDWPIHRELAWLRLKDGDSSEDNMSLVEHYAIDLEDRGAWTKAYEVYQLLESHAATPQATAYYRECAHRLNLKHAEPAWDA
jgi:hypothetical protein